MKIKEVERYLFELERYLTQIATSDRITILSEVQKEIEGKINSAPSKDIFEILSSIGDPLSVAKRHLSERGIEYRPMKKNRHIVRYFVLAAFGLGGLGVIAFSILVWKFTPLIKIDEENNRVQILGGMIDVDGKKGSVKVSKSMHIMGGKEEYEGHRDIVPDNIKQLNFNFGPGRLDLKTSINTKISWKCEGSWAEITQENDVLSFELERRSPVECDLSIPKDMKVVIKGRQGKIQIDKPLFHLDLNLNEGKVGFDLDEKAEYGFANQIKVGSVDVFPSSSSSNAYKMNINVQSGKIYRK